MLKKPLHEEDLSILRLADAMAMHVCHTVEMDKDHNSDLNAKALIRALCTASIQLFPFLDDEEPDLDEVNQAASLYYAAAMAAANFIERDYPKLYDLCPLRLMGEKVWEVVHAWYTADDTALEAVGV